MFIWYESGKIFGDDGMEGINVNPSKVETVLKMETPKSIKDIMVLNGRLVAMQRFLSKAAIKNFAIYEGVKE